MESCNAFLVENDFLVLLENKIRNESKTKELKIRKWTRLIWITEMEFGDDFGCMSKFISQNP
jgi:hypothetical protein